MPCGFGRLAEQAQQHDLLLEGLEDGLDGEREGLAVAGQVSGAAEDDPLVVPLGHALEDAGQDDPHERAVGLGEGVLEVGDGVGDGREGLAGQCRDQPGSQVGDGLLGHGHRALDDALLDPARVDDDDEDEPGAAERHQLDVPDAAALERGVLDERDLPGDLRQESHRARHHVVEVDRLVQELVDRSALGRAQRLDPRQAVDEQPVAEVGGHATGAGVRLGDEALVLEGSHVVADGRRRDAEVVALHERLRSHRLMRGHVVLDDGPKDGKPPFLQHAHLPGRRDRPRPWHSVIVSAKCTSSTPPARGPSYWAGRTPVGRVRMPRRRAAYWPATTTAMPATDAMLGLHTETTA